jgi:malate dehydrogenase
MREVAIVGAGELGGLTAHALARRNAAGVVRLIDDGGRVAEGKALDLSQAAANEGFSATLVGSTDLSAAAGAEIIVIADRHGGAEWGGEEGLTLLRRLNALAPRALFLCAGASHCELVERSARELHIPRTRIVGSAGEAYAAAAAAIVALELDVSSRDVALAILGVPPARVVIAWEGASVAGAALGSRLTEPRRRQLSDKIRALWPVGPHTLAAAASKVVDVLSGRSRRPITCFVAPDDGAGVRGRAAALPVRLSADGIVEVVMPALNAVERVALDNAMLL